MRGKTELRSRYGTTYQPTGTFQTAQTEIIPCLDQSVKDVLQRYRTYKF